MGGGLRVVAGHDQPCALVGRDFNQTRRIRYHHGQAAGGGFNGGYAKAFHAAQGGENIEPAQLRGHLRVWDGIKKSHSIGNAQCMAELLQSGFVNAVARDFELHRVGKATLLQRLLQQGKRFNECVNAVCRRKRFDCANSDGLGCSLGDACVG